MPALPDHPPRSAYVHVPFCRHRCGYCNFTLVAGRDDLIEAYHKALQRELAGDWSLFPAQAPLDRTVSMEQGPVPLLRGQVQFAIGRKPTDEPLARIEPVPAGSLDTLYFGGGTPTHLPPAALRRLFELVLQRFQLTDGAELTVEANPLDLDDARCDVLREFGVNRISLGVQSFRDEKLEVLERDHRRSDIARATEQARMVAPSVSLDLIYAAPGETPDQWRRDLEEALSTRVDHISIYGLTIEPGAAFYGRWRRGELFKTPEPLEAEMYELAIDRLAAAGYEQYEVSNFARPGHRSRHNETYWRGRSYYAFGPGAASYIAGRRSLNHRSTTAWLQRLLAGQSPIAEWEELPPEDSARERLVFGLRMLQGITRREFCEETGYDIDSLVGGELAGLVDNCLLGWTGDRLHLTRHGLLVSDSIWPRFLRR